MSLNVSELSQQYQAWAAVYYRKAGKPTRTANNIRDALRCLLEMWGSLPASDFRPNHLRAIQHAMDTSGQLCRRTINDRCNWIKAMFTWATDMELVDETLPARLARIKPLKQERCLSPEGPGMQPVSWEDVSATIAVAPLRLATMIELQWHTGMRPGEVCLMSRSTIDQQTWLYRPCRHKTEHHGRKRVVPLGPVARNLIIAWLPHVVGDWLFPSSIPGEPMRQLSYYRAIQRLNESHNLRGWSPQQIRHTTATMIARQCSPDAARVVLGHASLRTTDLYIDPDTAAAIEVMQRLG